MTTSTADIDVSNLRADCVETIPVDRDWGEGYGETWDYIEQPCCGACGEYARWVDGEELAENGGQCDADDSPAWRCIDQDCSEFGTEIDERGDGPMMSYAYALPSGRRYDETDVEKLRGLPLCIVRYDDGPLDGTYELALTGGGMDLSWEICEGYVRLGLLPPVHFADLPGMCGRGPVESLVPASQVATDLDPDAPETWARFERARAARDRVIMAACRRSAEMYRDHATNRADRIIQTLDRMEGR